MRGADSYRSPFETESTAGALLDATGTVLGWSAAAQELLDLPPEEVCGRPVSALLADPGSWQDVLAQRTGAAWVGRASLRHGSRGTLDIDFRVLPLDAGLAGEPRATGDQRLLVLGAPSALVAKWRQDHAFTQQLFLQDRIGLAVFDHELRLLRTNSHLLPYGGIPADLSGFRVEDLLQPEDARSITAHLREVLHTGVPQFGMETRVRTLDDFGDGRVMMFTAFRLQESDDPPIGVTIAFTDVTDFDKARQRLEIMHRCTVALGSSLSVTRLTEDLVAVLAPALADFAAIDIVQAVLTGEEPTPDHQRPTALRRTATAGTDPGPQARGPISAPLLARGGFLGAVTLWRGRDRPPFEEENLTLLQEIATRAATSLDNARRYTREHRAAVSLQRSLLPPAAADNAAAQTDSIYLPTDAASGVGGDWFDVIPLSSARVALVVGDVVGHGLQATATMGRLRTAVRALADLDVDPEELLLHLDDLVSQFSVEAAGAAGEAALGNDGYGDEESAGEAVGDGDVEEEHGQDAGPPDAVGATCLYAVYDPVSRTCTVASAGHPPPAVVRPDGSVEYVRLNPGPPLGVGGLPFEPVEFEVPPGSVLVLYTDGLVERGEGDLDEGMAELRSRLLKADVLRRPLKEVGRDVTAGLPPVRLPDDVTLLLARTRTVPPEDTASWTLDADPVVVSRARKLVTAQLERWGLDDLVFPTELVVSELVTNAIRYAGGPVGVRLIRAGVLICEVSDPSSTQPRMRRALATEEGGRGLFLVAQVSSRWGSRYTRVGKTIWSEQPLPPPEAPAGA
ncbi:SpoIIE family protein phosphatase [Kitasatospora sp. NPDC057223]|uniref:ATP-binding SpoIIE family protein phosphatase n=1 Tax=Kitasatospora sp. NPDC057223 TaxID=3346055 RepID=UPI00364097BC